MSVISSYLQYKEDIPDSQQYSLNLRLIKADRLLLVYLTKEKLVIVEHFVCNMFFLEVAEYTLFESCFFLEVAE